MGRADGYISQLGGFKPLENKDRRRNYKKLRKVGFNHNAARNMRDWNPSKVDEIISRKGI